MAYKVFSRRERIHKRIRKVIKGTSQRPRLAVFKSLKHIYGQVIDDVNQKTLFSFSSNSKEAKEFVKNGSNVVSAKEIGLKFGEKLKEAGIKKIVFDRGGFKYHGRIKAFADALREKGIEF
jgi:large subunit ribosomal protein L18